MFNNNFLIYFTTFRDPLWIILTKKILRVPTPNIINTTLINIALLIPIIKKYQSGRVISQNNYFLIENGGRILKYLEIIAF